MTTPDDTTPERLSRPQSNRLHVLVTGAGGFIGSHLVEALASHGHRVRALVRYNGRGDKGHIRPGSGKSPSVDVIAGDVTDASQVRRMLEGCDAVCHLAALIGIPYSYSAPRAYVQTNIMGTLNILEACRDLGVGRVVTTSTSEVYGTARYTPIDEAHPLQSQSPYAATKIAADKLAESFYASFDLPVVTLRPFNTYGPRQSARAIIPTVLTQALSGAREIFLGNLSPQRDLTFVSDTVEGFRLALETPGIEGEVIHLGTGEATSIGQLAQQCLDTVGSRASIISRTDRIRPQKSEVGVLLSNPAKARQMLGWEPKTMLVEGLGLTAEFISRHLGAYDTEGFVV